MTDDITQRLRVTMPDFKGIEISCPCRIRSLLMREAADEIEKLTRERDEARAEVERLNASNKRLHRALFRIAGKAPFADDPWTIAMKAMKLEAKP